MLLANSFLLNRYLFRRATKAISTVASPLCEEGILKAVESFVNGKASATDLISNEMIKYGIPVLLKPLHKLFNFISNGGSFPKSWNKSIITLLYKKSSKMTQVIIEAQR